MTTYRIGCESTYDRIGVLFAQLGTPDEPTTSALRRYLKEFLSDPRVIEVNRIFWWLLLNGIILRTRPKRSARLYSRVWTPEGSPLLVTTKLQAEGVATRLQNLGFSDVVVAYGMRYGNPNLTVGVDQLIKAGCRRILLVPLYPQYAAATTASTYDAVFRRLLRERWIPTLRVAEPYYRDSRFISALAGSVNRQLAALPVTADRLILSYHGIPVRYVQKGDPYCCECVETTTRLVPLLEYPQERIISTFQSRFGREQWLVPYTDETIEKLAEQEAVKNLAVACPGFSADCLETIDEIGHEASELFLEKGGESLTLIRCLNDEPQWLDALTDIVLDNLHGWILNSDEVKQDLNCTISCPARACGLTTFPSEDRTSD